MKNYVNPEMQMLSLDSFDIVTTSYTRLAEGEGLVIRDCSDL